MNDSLFKETVKIFEDVNKWTNFTELYNVKERVQNSWISKLDNALKTRFVSEDINPKWSYKNINNGRDCRWFLSEFGENSLCFTWEILQSGQFSLWNSGSHNAQKIFELLKDEKFKPLVIGFQRIDKSVGTGYQFVENGNFYFNDFDDGNLTNDKLVWYAGNRTQDFLEQLSAKINRFRNDELLTGLLIELNEATKI
jgi:hypothetical protein